MYFFASVSTQRPTLRCVAELGVLNGWAMPHILSFPLLSVFLLTGCYTYTHAPGAIGKVVDAETGAPIRDARITRPFVAGGGVEGRMRIPSEGLSAATVSSDKNGRFNLPPATHTQIAFMHLKNPKRISRSFIVTADGYATNQLHGVATSRTLWRVELERVLLSRP